MADNTKELIASSEFDPNDFVKGMDSMIAALERFSKQEDAIKVELKNINAALVTNRQELKNTTTEISNLDKASKTYKDDLQRLTAQKKLLIAQQKELKVSMEAQKTSLVSINTAANSYRASVEKITLVTKQAVAQGKGASFFDTVSLSKQVAEINAASGKLRNVFKGKISTEELDKFERSLAETNDEFAQLGQIVTFVKGKLDALDPESEEFEELNRVIQVGESVLDAYAKSTENVDKKSVSLRGRLIAMRTELVNLEEQGKENTKEFEDLQIAAGRLQDQVEDAQARIRVLASDTKALDFGIGAIRGVASAFGVAEGAAALFGLKNEDVAKSLQRLNAIMLILNGLQEIQTILQKQSVVAIVGQEIATKAAAVAQRIYAFAVGTSVGALKAFKIALLATGIGAIIVLLGLAAEAMGLFGGETEEATDKNKEFNDSLDATNELLQGRQRFLKLDSQIEEERLKRAGATEEQLQAARIKTLEAERIALRETYNQIRADQDAFLDQGLSGDFIDNANQEATRLATRINEITDQITLEGEKALTKRTDDTKKALDKQRALYEDYLNRLKELQRQLRDRRLEVQPQDEEAIRETFANSLSDALADLDADVKAGKLTRDRANILKELVKQISTVDLTEAIDNFKEESIQAETDLANSIFDLRLRNGQERAELMRDQFTREAALVRIEARNQADALNREQKEIITGINETVTAGLISPEAAQINIDRIKLIYEQLLENLATQTSRKQEEITARVFQAAQEETKTIFANVQLIVSETATAEIIAANEQFQQGRLNYKEYQEELTAIAARETDRRIATALREAEALLKAVQLKIPSEKDPERLKQLQDEERELRNRIAQLKREESIAEGEATKKDTDERAKRIQELANYANAIGSIISQVVGFWQQVNEAEQRSLERSISLQERRVEAAVKIAERGNSEYLRLEEDRLQELQVKQENAARRQIAINAVLQTSQALTAFISALAQGIALGGPLGGLAIAAAVIAAIASGYAIVQSLQSRNTVTLKGGTKYLESRDHPDGVDTVPAKLTKGEAVLPVDINRDYHPAVKAIFDRKIPAKEINNFVNNYRVNSRVLPTVNYEKMSEATQVMISYDGELLSATKEQTRKIEENTEVLGRVEYRLKTMGIEVNLDRNGLAVSLLKAVEQFKIDRRT